ncbi:MAG: hypothetical protein ACOYBY_14050 [Dermatophilaceae bacterium]
MILVLASASAPPLSAPRPDGVPITRLTPADLSRPGWRWDPHRPDAARLVTGAGEVGIGEVTGVLSCLPAVTPADLPHVAAADQSYVAAEMTAFLAAWLHALPCPVLDRPAWDCLAGVGMRRAEWLTAAERIGMPTAPRLPASLSGPTVRVGVAGDRMVAPDAATGRSARRLADELGVALLAPVFATGPREPVLLEVQPWWRAPEVGVTAAVDVLLAGGRQ